MAIKPIDMQVLLPKLHKNDLLKPHVVNKVENEQMLMQNLNRQDAEDKLSKVNNFDRKESPRVREDGHQGSGQESSEKKKREKEKAADKKETAKSGPGRNHIDIKV